MEIVVACEFRASRNDPSGTPARLIFKPDAMGASTVAGEFALSVGLLCAQREVVLWGWTIAEFISQLEALYDTLEGSASLRDDDENVMISFTATRHHRGLVLVSAKWPAMWSGLRLQPQERLHACEETVVAHLLFQGLTIEPAALPGVASAWKSLLRETGVSTQRPPEL